MDTRTDDVCRAVLEIALLASHQVPRASSHSYDQSKSNIHCDIWSGYIPSGKRRDI